MNKPYILILDSGGANFLMKRAIRSYDPDNFLSFLFESLFERTSLISRASVLSGDFGNTAAVVCEHRLSQEKVVPVLEQVEKKRYPPVAIIGCPYLTRALFSDFSQIGCDNKNLAGLGFKGKILLNLTIDQENYRQELPDLFELDGITCLSLDEDFDFITEMVDSFIRNSGLEPKVNTKIDETKAETGLPVAGLAVN